MEFIDRKVCVIPCCWHQMMYGLGEVVKYRIYGSYAILTNTEEVVVPAWFVQKYFKDVDYEE